MCIRDRSGTARSRALRRSARAPRRPTDRGVPRHRGRPARRGTPRRRRGQRLRERATQQYGKDVYKRQAIRRSSIRRQCRLSIQPAGTTRAGEAVRRMWSTSEVSPCAGRLPRYACPQPALCGGTPSAGYAATHLRPAMQVTRLWPAERGAPTRYGPGSPSCGRTSGGRTPLRGCPALRCGRRP